MNLTPANSNASKDRKGHLTRYGRGNYRFFSVALAVFPRTAFAATVGFNALASSTECAAGPFVRRTPGLITIGELNPGCLERAP
jgi:hypothetical protein